MPEIGVRFAPDVPLDIQDDVELRLLDVCQRVAAVRPPLLAHPWRQRVAKWFGNTLSPHVIQMIEENVRRIQVVLVDPCRFVYVSNARTPAGLYNWDQETEIAYCYRLSEPNRSQPTLAHQGSGIGIYIGKAYARHTPARRMLSLLHELTHKILNTDDYAQGAREAERLAQRRVCVACTGKTPVCEHTAYDNAENWALFLAGFDSATVDLG